MSKVLFVCTANVCRSPMAEILFNVLAEERGLGCRAESAGVAALEGRPLTPESVAVLEEIGIDAGARRDEHGARQVSGPMIREADLVLAIGPRHVAKLREAFGEMAGHARTLPEYAGSAGEEEVPDPYGRSMAVYRAAAHQIFGYVDLVTKHLL